MNTWREPLRGPGGRTGRRFSRLPAFIVALTLALTVAFSGSTGWGWHRAEAIPGAPPSVAVPAYFWPGPEWETLLRAGPEVKYVILNPDSGPGAQSIADYVGVVARARIKGFVVAGYVDTAYGARSASLVQADIARYRSWYGVNQFFFDQTPSACSSVGYYAALQTFVQQDPNGFVVLNPGTNPGECYLGVSDMVVNFEGSESSYAGWTPAPYAANYGAERFWHIVYSVVPANVTSVLSVAQQRNAGFVYLTDEGFPNPFFRIPSAPLWQAQVPSSGVGGRGAAPQSPGTSTIGDRPAAPQASVPPLLVPPSTAPGGFGGFSGSGGSGAVTTTVPFGSPTTAPANPALVSGASPSPASSNEANVDPGSPYVAPMLVPDSVPEPAASPARPDAGDQPAVTNPVRVAEGLVEASSIAPAPAPALVAAQAIPPADGPRRIVVNVLGATIRAITSTRPPRLAPGRRTLTPTRRT